MTTLESIYHHMDLSRALESFEQQKSCGANNVSWSQLRQKRANEEDHPGIHTITNEELESEWKVSGIKIATDYYSKICDIHENCGSTCSSMILQAMPFMDPTVSVVSLAMPAASKRRESDTHKHRPRDADWAKAENFKAFQYSSIDSAAENIRVLRLKKGFFRTDVIECEIVTIALGQGLEFEALSYCWGSPCMSEVMICDGKKVWITPTLNAALKAYRESRDGGRLLWVDALSINQANQEELSQQIPLMRSIYSEATEVFVHLGHAEFDTSLGLDWMGRLAIVWNHVTQAEKFGAIVYEKIAVPEQTAIWEAYFKVFASPWFRRTWVLQEVALSRKAVLSIGRFTVPWAALEDSIAMLNYGGLFFVMMHMDTRPIPGVYEGAVGLMQMHVIRELTQSSDNSSLIKLIMATKDFKVSDPRDKIIGMLGLVGNLTAELKSLCDYRLSISQVYHRTAVYLIKAGHSSQVLSHAGLQRRVERPGLPSWAPDWVSETRENCEVPLYLFRPDSFNAGGSRGECYMNKHLETPDIHELLVFGLCHHKVVTVSHLDGGIHTVMDDFVTTMHKVGVWYKHAEQCWKNSAEDLVYDDPEEAFARTLLVNATYSGKEAHERLSTITDVVAVFRSVTKALQDGTIQKASVSGFTDTGRLTQVGTFLMQMRAVIRGRRLAVTDTGYLGLVPACTQVGDTIAILFGFPAPFVIRPDTKRRKLPPFSSAMPPDRVVHARLVGDAYLHGVMDAEEVVRHNQSGKVSWAIHLV